MSLHDLGHHDSLQIPCLYYLWIAVTSWGMLVKWFPIAFSTVWNWLFLLLDWVWLKAKEHSIPCYLTHSWWVEKNWIHTFFKSICENLPDLVRLFILGCWDYCLCQWLWHYLHIDSSNKFIKMITQKYQIWFISNSFNNIVTVF